MGIEKRKKLIVLEGGDASGKSTQTNLLLSTSFEGQSFVKFDFPRYDTVIGKVVKNALHGKYGDFLHMHPVISSMPYTLDRVAAKSSLVKALKKSHVVCNRYTPSNVAFQAAKLKGKKRKSFIRYLEKVEFTELELPKPDLVIFLDVPTQFSINLLKSRGGTLDQHETDFQYQERVAEVYRELAHERNSWKVVPCVLNGNMRTVFEINADIVNLVSEVIE